MAIDFIWCSRLRFKAYQISCPTIIDAKKFESLFSCSNWTFLMTIVVNFWEVAWFFSVECHLRQMGGKMQMFKPSCQIFTIKSMFFTILYSPDKSDFVSISFSNILERGLSRAGKLFSIKLFETFVAKVEFRLRERTKVMFSLDCSSIPTASLLFAPIVQPLIRSSLTLWKCWVNAFN